MGLGVPEAFIASALIGGGAAAYNSSRQQQIVKKSGERDERAFNTRQAELKRDQELMRSTALDVDRARRTRAASSKTLGVAGQTRTGSPLGLPGSGTQYARPSLY